MNELELREQLAASDEISLTEAITDIGKQRVDALARDVMPFLSHSSGAVRAAAAHTVGFHFQMQAARATLIRMAQSDPDSYAQQGAVFGLSGLCKGTRDREVLNVLHGLLRDAGAPSNVRVMSALGILNVGGIPRERFKRPSFIRDIERDTPWDLIDEVMAGAQARPPLASMSAIPQQIRQQLEGGGVWLSREDVHPHDGLLRAIRSAGADRPIYAATVLALLSSEDLRHRTGAVGVLSEVVPDLGAGRVAAVLRENTGLLRGVRPAWLIGEEDLEQAAIRAVVPHIRADGSGAIEWLRGLVPMIAAQADRYQVWISAVVGALAALDTDWFFANALTLSPTKNLWVIHQLPPARRAEYIAARAPWPPERKDVVGQNFWKQFPPEEAARLRGLMWPEAT